METRILLGEEQPDKEMRELSITDGEIEADLLRVACLTVLTEFLLEDPFERSLDFEEEVRVVAEEIRVLAKVETVEVGAFK